MFRWLLEYLGNPSTSVSLKKGVILCKRVPCNTCSPISELTAGPIFIIASGVHFGSWNKRRLKASRNLSCFAVVLHSSQRLSPSDASRVAARELEQKHWFRVYILPTTLIIILLQFSIHADFFFSRAKPNLCQDPLPWRGTFSWCSGGHRAGKNLPTALFSWNSRIHTSSFATTAMPPKSYAFLGL